ncbi:MAG: aldose 1-epimerase family protein, partial [Bacteroidota bacterium]|nr:aldose 1-epimerase family protein [Bacteroidota bacterium]
MITLSNPQIEARVSETGAELQSLKSNGLEYIWQADPVFWGKHAPVLFPIVGELKGGKYLFEGNSYSLTRHGFARERTFYVESQKDSEVVLALHNDQATLEKYPFQFIFRVKFRIEIGKLFCTYSVENTQSQDIYFSVGGHPAFKVPLEDNLLYTDYALFFQNDDSLTRFLLEKGLTNDLTETIELNQKTLPLSPSLFYKDAIVLKMLKSKEIKLFSQKGTHGLHFKFEGFPYFGIWAAKDAPFVCLEPWCGIADNLDHDQQLIHKEGIINLKPGMHW